MVVPQLYPNPGNKKHKPGTKHPNLVPNTPSVIA